MEKSTNKPLKVRHNDVDYYTREGAIDRLGISDSTLKREVKARKIRYLKHPTGWLFEQAWLDEWLHRRTVQPLKKLTI